MNPMLYSEIAVISRDNDRRAKVAVDRNHMAFSAQAHLCPALAAEFIPSAFELPIVFLMENGLPAPVFVVGLQREQNLFVSPEGHWTGTYLPRYLERYPFILGELTAGQRVLALDARATNEDDGQALFDEDGEQTPYLKERLATVERYAADATRGEAFVARLRDLDLLRPTVVEVTIEGTTYGWKDLFVVDEQKLAALPDAALLELARTGQLALIHAHLMSLRNFETLRSRLATLVG